MEIHNDFTQSYRTTKTGLDVSFFVPCDLELYLRCQNLGTGYLERF